MQVAMCDYNNFGYFLVGSKYHILPKTLVFFSFFGGYEEANMYGHQMHNQKHNCFVPQTIMLLGISGIPYFSQSCASVHRITPVDGGRPIFLNMFIACFSRQELSKFEV